MKYEIEIERDNVTPAQFLSYVRRKADEMLRSELSLDYFKSGYDHNFDIYHKRDDDDTYRGCGCIREKSISRPYEMQTYICYENGALYNEICEFEFDTEKTGHGYYYLCNVTAD